jgi:hypothetical protein
MKKMFRFGDNESLKPLAIYLKNIDSKNIVGKVKVTVEYNKRKVK